MNGKRLANRIVNECEKMGAESVTLIDVRNRAPFFDFLVIATVDNTVLAGALLRKVAKAVDLDEAVVAFTESSPSSDWVVSDYGDTASTCSWQRCAERYDLEGLWSPPPRKRRKNISTSSGDEQDAGVAGDGCARSVPHMLTRIPYGV